MMNLNGPVFCCFSMLEVNKPFGVHNGQTAIKPLSRRFEQGGCELVLAAGSSGYTTRTSTISMTVMIAEHKIVFETLASRQDIARLAQVCAGANPDSFGGNWQY